jgi:hypothetical protein
MESTLQPFFTRKADPRRGYPMSLIIGDDFHMAAPLNTAHFSQCETAKFTGAIYATQE